jgi:DNA-binding CsgD family transcriptional regulator
VVLRVAALLAFAFVADRWPLTGRAEELRLIGEALTGGEYKGMVVAGAAGVGKTRLARAAADAAARSGWLVRRVAGTATGRAVTLGAFARWAGESDMSSLALARRVFAGLTSGTSGAPLLVLVDDAHLLDDLSALIVHQLVLQEAASVIATIRTGEPAPDAVTALWKDSLLRRMELQPLSRNETGSLLQAVLDGPVRPDSAERLWKLSNGNVLFLRHLVEHEQELGSLAVVDGEWRWTGTPSASPSLTELVEQQIGEVPDDLQHVVDLVAIAEPIDRKLLTALADPEAIESAEGRGLIMGASSADAVFVGHPLYGEIRLSQCGPLRLKRLRGLVAAAMAKTDHGDLLRLGLLWLESDLPPDADILIQSAKVAASRMDIGLAERLARGAVAVRGGPETMIPLAFILFLQEKGDEAEEVLDTLGPPELAAHGFIDGSILRAANLLWPLHKPDTARIVIDDAIRLADADRVHSLRTFRAAIEAMTAEPSVAIETMATVDEDRLDGLGLVVGYAAEAIALGDVGRVDDANARASEGYRVLAETPLEESFHGTGLAEFHAFALMAAGFVDDAVIVADEQYRQYAELPGMSRSMAIAAQGMVALGKGDLAAALRYLRSAGESFGGYGEVSGLFYRFRILHTEALARSGAVDAAMASLETSRRARHPAYRYVESGYLLSSAWVSAVQGRNTDAREITSRATEFARSHGQLAREVLCLQTGIQFGDTGAATRLEELAAQVRGPRAPLAARYARALADDDAASLDAVSSDFEVMGDVLVAADAAAQAAASHRSAGLRGSALTASARAQLLARRCGGAVSPALAASKVPLPFTRREHEIANLVSRGLSNRDIAKATSLSIRTIEGHVYQATSKAGVSSRAELSELVQQFNDADIASDE